jgi:hypothetical protein
MAHVPTARYLLRAKDLADPVASPAEQVRE